MLLENSKVGYIGVAIGLAIMVAIAIGWILNILAIINSDVVLSALVILRFIGIFIVPLGGFLGYI